MLNDQELDEIFISLTKHCTSKSDHAFDSGKEHHCRNLTCFQKNLCYIDSGRVQREDTNALKKYVALCREETRLKTTSELDSFIQDLFIKSVVSVDLKSKESDGSKEISKFNMCFTTIGGHKVCRKCCSTSYGFSNNKFNTCSKIYKDTGLQKVNSLNHRKWADDHIHNYSYAETENLFKSNIIVKNENQSSTFIEKVGM